MKKLVILMLCVVLFGAMVKPVFALELNNENKYGMPLKFDDFSDYQGEIVIDGIYVYKDDVDYIFTVLYSNGELVTLDNNGEETVKSSFFSPDSDILEVSWINEFDRISSKNNIIQYRIDVEKASQVEDIVIFMYDILYQDKNISRYINLEDVNLNLCPTIDEIINGYEVSSEEELVELAESPSVWAQKSVEELLLSEMFRESTFEAYKEGISRIKFVYLMVELYETLTELSVSVDDSITFDDTTDEYAIKAAKIGITNGIGDNKFGPDIILNREQMATFMIRTLKLANIDLDYNEEIKSFDDDEEISIWAKNSIYTAKHFGIITGIGENMFSPTRFATNEQALTITHRLLGRYGNLKWYQEFDNNRVYIRIDGELYNLKFDNNVIIDSSLQEKDKIYFKSFNDIEIFLNAGHLRQYNLSYDATSNPNFKGALNVYDYDHMRVEVENQYFGVDKVGEKTIITIDSEFNTKEITSTIKTDMNNDIKSYKGFVDIKYYDENGMHNTIVTLPTNEIFSLIGIDYSIEYHELWDIYILEFNK